MSQHVSTRTEFTEMPKLFHPLLALIASATDSLLARYVLYLTKENRILRDRLPAEIHTRPHERAQLLKYGKPLGKAINELITIVTPGTFHRWVREEKRGRKKEPVGRPRKSAVLRELVLRIAKETGFGYTKILGELRKLGIGRICRQTVKNIVKEEGIEPSPKRSSGTWDQFLKSHTETLWACDFSTKRSVTSRGLVDLYLIVFMHLESREVFVSPCTRHPDSAWVTRQAKAFVNHVAGREQKPTYLIHDRDTKSSAEFKQFLKDRSIKPKLLPIRSPNLNARVERFVQTIKHECLNHFIAFGKKHLDYLVAEFVDYYNNHRAHSSREHLPPCSAGPPTEYETIKLDEIVCKEHVGGLIKSYERKAA